MILGAHESIAGGLAKAFERAEADTAEAVQIFTKNARGWKAKPLAEDDVRAFRAEAARTGMPAVAHCTYLVNLAAEEPSLREKSLASFTDERDRCAALGVPWLVVHPGAHPDLAKGIGLIAQALDESFAASPTTGVLLEVTAGQGTSIGWQFEHLARIFDASRHSDRLGICLDTCHLYAAGYDLVTDSGYEQTLRALDQSVGLKRVQAFHLNDCLKPLGCRVDRHAEIGQGTLGLAAFGRLLNDPRFTSIPGVLETPEIERYRQNLEVLRSLLGAAGGRSARASADARPPGKQAPRRTAARRSPKKK